MTLRLRLLVVLIGVVAAGLVISDLVVYTELRSFMVSRLDPQLRSVSYSISGILLCEDRAATAPPPYGCGFSYAAGHVRPPGSSPRGGLVPTGTIGELVGADGKVLGAPQPFLYGDRSPSPPKLPNPLPKAAGGAPSYFTAHGGGSHAVMYRVMARKLRRDGLTVVVAIPLTDVDETLGRLSVVMVFVTIGVLVGLGLLAWAVVRRALRPLDDMAIAASAIAAGDLGRRITPAEGRTEVGRLGMALNGMLGTIETAFAARTASERRLRRFLADASHELRTPLTSIRGYAEIFDLGARSHPEDLATAMHRIREEADRMNLLVDDLLLLASLDRQRPTTRRRFDLVDLVRRARSAAAAAWKEHEFSLSGPDRLDIVGDAERLRQVVDNLLANAAQHSPPGAIVKIEIGLAPDGAAVVEVSDLGPGVSPEDALRIFEPFYRADASRARATGGLGLGLSIVAAIVGAHGGSVGVRPNADGGSRFWFRLPGPVGAVATAGPVGAGGLVGAAGPVGPDDFDRTASPVDRQPSDQNQ